VECKQPLATLHEHHCKAEDRTQYSRKTAAIMSTLHILSMMPLLKNFQSHNDKKRSTADMVIVTMSKIWATKTKRSSFLNFLDGFTFDSIILCLHLRISEYGNRKKRKPCNQSDLMEQLCQGIRVDSVVNKVK
jgi:hypothetical protein